MTPAARLAALALVAALVAAPPAAGARKPTRLWYTLEATYTFTESAATPLAKTETRIELHFATDDSVLLRSTDRGLGFLSDGTGQGYYTKLTFSKDNRTTPPGQPERRASVTEFTRGAGRGATRLLGDRFELYWSSARGDFTRAGTTRHVVVEHGGAKVCKSQEHGTVDELGKGQARLFVPLQVRWETPFGRRVMVGRAEGTTRGGGRYRLVVRVTRCPGTTSCAGDPPAIPKDLPAAQ